MTFSEGYLLFRRVRWIVAIVSTLAGAGSYKFGPALWHKAQDQMDARAKAHASAHAAGGTNAIIPVITDSGTSTNADGVRLSDCDLGAVSLTNHYETCVSLGRGKECILTPKMIDSRNVQLTLAVESKTPNGKVHDLSITEVVARLGKPLDVAVGGFSFSLTPNMNTE